jgi:sialidase-1
VVGFENDLMMQFNVTVVVWQWLCLLAIFGMMLPAASPAAESPVPSVHRALVLAPSDGNPRNSEGDFVRLADGRILFVYTRYYAGRGSDHDHASLAARTSADGGRTWSETDLEVLANEGQMNVMSVSLLRLQNGEIALVYLRKNSTQDCLPYLRLSSDEAQSWSEPHRIIPQGEAGYYVVNNDRLVQLSSGRLIVPVAQHCGYQMQAEWGRVGVISCYLSDDDGRTWRRSRASFYATRSDGSKIQTQEPGVVELNDGRLLMFLRTDAGFQYFCHSSDNGETWSEPAPGPLASPLSPMSIERIPQTGDLLAIWNDATGKDPANAQRRTPMSVAVSKDEGQTWIHRRNLENDEDGFYCYTAMEFVDQRVLFGYCAGTHASGRGLGTTQLTSVSLEWFYEPD